MEIDPHSLNSSPSESQLLLAERRVRYCRTVMAGMLLVAIGPIVFTMLTAAIAALWGKRLQDAESIPVIGEFLFATIGCPMFSAFTIPLMLIAAPFAVVDLVIQQRKLVRLRDVQASGRSSGSDGSR